MRVSLSVLTIVVVGLIGCLCTTTTSQNLTPPSLPRKPTPAPTNVPTPAPPNVCEPEDITYDPLSCYLSNLVFEDILEGQSLCFEGIWYFTQLLRELWKFGNF